MDLIMAQVCHILSLSLIMSQTSPPLPCYLCVSDLLGAICVLFICADMSVSGRACLQSPGLLALTDDLLIKIIVALAEEQVISAKSQVYLLPLVCRRFNDLLRHNFEWNHLTCGMHRLEGLCQDGSSRAGSFLGWLHPRSHSVKTLVLVRCPTCYCCAAILPSCFPTRLLLFCSCIMMSCIIDGLHVL